MSNRYTQHIYMNDLTEPKSVNDLPLQNRERELLHDRSRGVLGRGVWVFDMKDKNEEFISSAGFTASFHTVRSSLCEEINVLEGMSYPGIESFEGITYGIRKNKDDERSFVFVVFKNEIKCIALTNNMPFSAFRDKTRKAFNIKGRFFLMSKGGLLKDDKYIIELSKEARKMMIIPCMPLKVDVYLNKRMNETLILSLQILNTDNVQEVKEKVIAEYKSLLSGINETKSLALVSIPEKKLLEEENAPLVLLCNKRFSSLPACYDSDDSDYSLNVHPVIEVQLHLLPPGHICVYINAKKMYGIRGTSPLLFIDSNDSTCKLREKIAPVIHAQPDSLELYVNNKRIPEVKCLLNCQLIKEKSQIYVERRPKIQIVIQLRNTGDKCTLKVHKLLKISSLKKSISESMHIPTFQQDIYLKNELLQTDNTLQDYKIENDDTIVLAVYSERIEIQAYMHSSVRVESGYQNKRYYITLDDIEKIKCRDILHSLALQLGLSWNRLCLIFNHQCVAGEEEIRNLRICDGSTVFITYNTNASIIGENGIKIIFHSKPDGGFEAGMSVFCDGIPFYPPSGILLAEFLKNINKDTSTTKVNKNVPSCSKGICVSETSKHGQETISKCPILQRQVRIRPRKTSSIHSDNIRLTLSKPRQPKTRGKGSSELQQKVTKNGTDESGTKQSSSETLKTNIHSAKCSSKEANFKSISFTPNIAERNPEHNVSNETSELEISNCKQHQNTMNESENLETVSNITNKHVESANADAIPAETIGTETDISTKQETTTEGIGKSNTEVSNNCFDNSEQLQLVPVTTSITEHPYVKENVFSKDIPSDDLSVQSISDTDTSEKSKVLRRTRKESMLIKEGKRVYKRDLIIEDKIVSDPDPETSDVSGTEFDLVTSWFGDSSGNNDEIDRILHKLSMKVGRDWKNLARHLGMPNEDIEATEEKCRTYGIQEMCCEILTRWKKRSGKSVNVKQMEDALQEMQRGDLLDILSKGETSDDQ